MHAESRIVDIIRDRQRAMRREFDRRHITMKVVAMDSGIDYSTLLTYFPADPAKVPVQIPGSVIFALTGHVPADILSLLLPADHLVVRVPEFIDHDEFAAHCRDFIALKDAAHHPSSESGREIGPGENSVLLAAAARVIATGSVVQLPTRKVG